MADKYYSSYVPFNQFDSVQKQVHQNSTVIAAGKNQIDKNSDDITILQKQVNKNSNDITALQTQIISNSSDIAFLKAQISQGNMELAKLQTQLKLVSPNTINQLQLNVNDLQNKDDLLKKDIFNTTQDLTALTQDLTKVSKQSADDVATLNGQINQICLTLSKHSTDIKQLKQIASKKPKSWFSNSIVKDVIGAIIIAIIFYLGKAGWDIIIQKETSRHKPQITFVQSQGQPKNLSSQNDK